MKKSAFLCFAATVCLALAACDTIVDSEKKDGAEDGRSNLIVNGGFSGGLDHWDFWVDTDAGAQADADCADGCFRLNIEQGINKEWDIGLAQGISLKGNTKYRLSFTAHAEQPNTVISAGLQEFGTDRDGDGKAYENWNRAWINLSQEANNYSIDLIMRSFDDPTGALVFNFDFLADSNVIVLDDIAIEESTEPPSGPPAAPEMIRNGDFSQGFNFWWWWADDGHVLVPDCSSKALVLRNLTPGTPRGSMCIKARSPGLLNEGEQYRVSFTASSTFAGDIIRPMLSEGGTDLDGDGSSFTHLDEAQITLGTEPAAYEAIFTSPYTSSTIDMNIRFDNTRGTITLDDITMRPISAD